MNRRLLSGLAVGAVCLLSACAPNAVVQTAQAVPIDAQVAAITPTQSDLIQQYQEQLMDPQLDLASREALIEKIEIEKRAEANRAAGIANPAPKQPQPEAAAAAVVAEAVQVERGVFEGSEGLVRPGLADIVNYWQGPLNDQVVMVFAGSAPGNKEQGVLVVMTTNVNPAVSDTAVKMISAESGISQLRILSEQDNILRLTDLQGHLVGFDVNKQQFVP